MNTWKKKIAVAVILVILLAVLAVAGVLIYTLENNVIVEGELYPRKQTVLDLRDRNIAPDVYDQLTQQLPGCTIIWQVPFQGEFYPSFTQELTIRQLSQEDLVQLDYFPQLKTVYAQECRDYTLLMQLQKKKPDCQLHYQVELDGALYDNTVNTLCLTKITQEEAALLEYLPELHTIDASLCTDYGVLLALQEKHPDWTIKFRIMVGNQEFSTDAQQIEVEGATYDQLAGALQGLKELKSVSVSNPEATGPELLSLREQYPNVDIHWSLTIQGRVIPDDATEVDLSDEQLLDLQQAEDYAAYFPNIEKLVMCDCGFDNETMAQFREEKRAEYKVVWRVYLGSICKARTDDTKFMPLTQGDGYFQDKNAPDLKYCEDMIAIDLGHSRVRNIDFAAYMPHLKYLILADTDVRDLTPISNCKELVWLEIGWCAIESYEPLLGCTALEDLNIGRTFANPEPISQMTWLKNLWCMERSAAIQYQWRQDLPDTNIVGIGTDVVAYGWRKLPNYYKMRDALDMYYMK